MDIRIANKIDSIQIIRCVAAFTISLSHITFIVNKCNIVFGVDIFLIITGFLSIYTTNKKKSLNAKDFIIKKLVRLVPLYWLLTIGTFFIYHMFPGISEEVPTVIELIKSMLFIPYSKTSRIFASTVIRPIVGPAHTMMYIVFFYVVYIISAKINFRFRGLITSVALFLIYIMGRVLPIGDNVFLTFYSNAWILNFVWGICLYYIYQKLMNQSISKKVKALLLGVSSICFIWLVIDGFGLIKSIPYILRIELPAALFIISFIIATDGFQFNKTLIRLGDISYSYYLIHYYCLMFVSVFFVDLTVYSISGLVFAFFALAIACGIAYISWLLIEQKLSRYLLNKIL